MIFQHPCMDPVLGIEDTQWLELTTQFRIFLSDGIPPSKIVIESGFVPRFVEYLGRDDVPEFQLKAAWALSVIAGAEPENAYFVSKHGAIPIFFKLLSSPRDDVRDQVFLTLANIARHSPEYRDLILSHGVLPQLLSRLNQHTKPSALRSATRALFLFCSGDPRPPFDDVKPALQDLACLLTSEDEEVVSAACSALSCFCDGTNDEIQAVYVAGVGPIVKLLCHSSLMVLIPVLHTVAQFVSSNDVYTQGIIHLGALPQLHTLLINNSVRIIKRNVSRVIANITAGNVGRIQNVVEANLIGPLVELSSSAEVDVRKQAAMALSNVASGGSKDHIRNLVGQGCIKLFCDLLSYPDKETVVFSLRAVGGILEVGETEKIQGKRGGVNPYIRAVEDALDVINIHDFFAPDDTDIYDMSHDLVKRYWLNPSRTNFRG